MRYAQLPKSSCVVPSCEAISIRVLRNDEGESPTAIYEDQHVPQALDINRDG